MPESEEGAANRREPRFPVSSETIVEVTWYNIVLTAKTIDRSFHGMLLEFDTPPDFPVGDLIVIDLVAPDRNWQPMPYLGVGKVASVRGNRVGVNLDLSDFILVPGTPTVREGVVVYG